jgi:uncharacterized protein (TIGR00369 family)
MKRRSPAKSRPTSKRVTGGALRQRLPHHHPTSRAERIAAKVPFWKLLGLKIERAGRTGSAVRLKYRREFSNSFTIHGGVIAGMMDSAGAIAVAAQHVPFDHFTTVEMKVNYLRPGLDRDLRCTARILKMGKTLIVVEADVFGEGQHLAKGLITYMKID